jgi:hypothetical protein
MNGDNVLRGPWAGASTVPPIPDHGTVEPPQLVQVHYRCSGGHVTRVRFGGPTIPHTWTCGQCDLTADRDPNAG